MQKELTTFSRRTIRGQTEQEKSFDFAYKYEKINLIRNSKHICSSKMFFSLYIIMRILKYVNNLFDIWYLVHNTQTSEQSLTITIKEVSSRIINYPDN